MIRKIWKASGLCLLSVLLFVAIIWTEIKDIPAVSSISGLALGFLLPVAFMSIQDLSDKEKWEITQRKLQRGKIIKDETIIRVSFAYLFRIKIGNKYLLIQNERGTMKYQPVGGVYQTHGNERDQLKRLFHVIDDDKIPIDKSSKKDYRMQLQNRYLRDFVKRFDKEAERENVSNLRREFREELIDNHILNWDHIEYRFCGRHISDLQYSDHFRCYELLLADIVELIPTMKQENDLNELLHKNHQKVIFANAEEIKSLGINTYEGKLVERIADHSIKILQENESELICMPYNNTHYSIDLVD